MSAVKLVVRVKLAWWFAPYVNTLVFLCRIFNTEPNYDKLCEVMNRAAVYEVTAE